MEVVLSYRLLVLLTVVAGTLVGCSEDGSFAAIESARLVVDPAAVTFSLPTEQAGSVEARVLVTNAGGSALVVESVTVVESDDVKEVNLLDADDWAGGATEIGPGDSVPLRIQWTIRDATVDTGTVTITSNAGDAVVTFQTLDIDPVLVVESDPAGTQLDDGLEVRVLDAPAGTVRPVGLTLEGGSFATLEVREICLLDGSGECIEAGVRGEFSLCDGHVQTLRGCQQPSGTHTLQQGDTAELTVLYRPEPGTGNTSSARIQISSNAAQTPLFTVTVRGTPCTGAGCVGGAPVVTLESPRADQTHYEGMDIAFRAAVTDDQDAPETLRIWWLRDDDVLDLPASADSDGINQGTAQLPAGPHFLSVFAEDSEGNIGVDGVLIVVDEPNDPPHAPTVTISPNPAYTGDALVATASGAFDPEGDAVTVSWHWQLNGTDTEYTGTDVPAEATQAGQTWTATSTAADAFHPGVSGSASVTIRNTAPIVRSVLIRGPAFSDGALTCIAEVEDPDGGVVVTYSWRVGNDTYESDTLDVSRTGAGPGDTITCLVRADDGDNTAELSASIQLNNRAPDVLSVDIAPALILQSTLAQCAATASDPDGEVPAVSYAWTINGADAGVGPDLQLTQRTAPVGAELVCRATATDSFGGTDTGLAARLVLLCDRREPRACDGADVVACRDDGQARVVVDECGDLGCVDGECVQGCGDGVLEDGEECDDGPDNSDALPNACRTNCELPGCGDRVIDDGEVCDDGGMNSDVTPNACRTSCQLPQCGDRVVDDGEQCDDGNEDNDDGCRNDCTQPIVDGDCRGGAVKLSGAPGGGMIVCKDESNQTCEQDFESLCPADWHLCTMDEFNTRNDGWDFDSPSQTPALGVIYCRPNSGAGHFTVPDNGGNGTNLGNDERFNCYYGSSRPSCTAGYGCNEQRARALCCAPQALCGNGEVDHPEEQCDDANQDDGDECLSTCTWRVPTQHGFRGTNCQ